MDRRFELTVLTFCRRETLRNSSSGEGSGLVHSVVLAESQIRFSKSQKLCRHFCSRE